MHVRNNKAQRAKKQEREEGIQENEYRSVRGVIRGANSGKEIVNALLDEGFLRKGERFSWS